MMKAICTKCGKHFYVSDEELKSLYLGNKIKCPNCGEMVGMRK